MSLVTNPLVTDGPPIVELTASQVDTVRSELLALRAEHSEWLQSVPDQTTTRDDGLAFERFLTDRSRDAMIEIDAAMARLGDGTYGLCESCRRPIAFERLEAIPHARYCVGCADHAPTSSGRPGRP